MIAATGPAGRVLAGAAVRPPVPAVEPVPEWRAQLRVFRSHRAQRERWEGQSRSAWAAVDGMHSRQTQTALDIAWADAEDRERLWRTFHRQQRAFDRLISALNRYMGRLEYLAERPR